MIQFTVPCVAIAQPRQRTRVMNIGNRQTTQNYTPTKHPVNAFKAACQLAARAAYQGAPLDGPLQLQLVFVLPRPKAMIRKRGGNPREPHAKKPDFENLAKGICDAMNGLLWRDDSQLSAVTIEKWIASADEQPHVLVSVTWHTKVLQPIPAEVPTSLFKETP